MKLPSFTLIVSGVFMAYIAHSTWTIYSLFFPKPCPQNANCIHSYIARNPQVQLELWVYTSLKKDIRSEKDLKLLWRHSNFSSTEQEERVFNLSIPKKTRSNGTLYAHIFVTRRGEWPFNSRFVSHASITQTAFAVPEAVAFSLIGDDKTTSKKGRGSTPISHLKSKLTVNVMTDDISFDRNGLPMEVYRFLKITPQSEYLPIVYIDELSCRMRDYVPLNESAKELPVTVRYEPISVGKLRLWVNMQEAMKTLHSIGFSEKDTDEMKGIFADTNFYLLMLTFAVAAFHMLFDFLAFKNDISYWKNRNSMVGLSSRTVVWRCVSTIIIFLYLMDEETSLLVLIPAGIGSVIEVWKVTKAFKVKVSWATWRPSFHLGTTSDKEKETQSFDSQAMKYLSYLLYPLCMVGAVYSLLYTPHKSWRSWCIKSLVNGIYAFGFLFMLPQLFVNYKLKSVAHLPWRAFMYKAFNTFIDDVFAFIITMPTAHRIACFRDDIVFLVYLYQRWLYPVDKTRVNEYGQSFDSQDNQDKTRVNEYGQSFDSQDNQDKSEEESKKTK